MTGVRNSILLCPLVALCLHSLSATAADSFRVDLQGDGETIGDMRPVFLKFENRAMPAISPREVARRYQELFEASNDPAVRIDALNRLTNIRNLAGDDIDLSEEREHYLYQEAIASYDAVLAQGVFAGKLDELLYQMAKAHAYVGQQGESIDRLRQLVGLYPNSSLVPEARFRIAESAYSEGDYAAAESGYQQLLSGRAPEGLQNKARFMLGWSQYRQGESGYRRAMRTFLEVLGQISAETGGFLHVPPGQVAVIDDAFRMVAVMADRPDGSKMLASAIRQTDSSSFIHLIYDRLADYYVARERFSDSAQVTERFIQRFPAHESTPAFRAQLVDIWERTNNQDQIWRAKYNYVTAFQAGEAYEALSGAGKNRWQEYCRGLADRSYRKGSIQDFAVAADLYGQMAERVIDNGMLLRLAGDSLLQAGEANRAAVVFRRAAYDSPQHEGAADSGWAAVVIMRDGADADPSSAGLVSAFASEGDRFAASFPDDFRLPGLYVDLANRMLERHQSERAEAYASAVVAMPHSEAAERYGAWLALGRAFTVSARYGDAERSWRSALALVSEIPSVRGGEGDRAQLRQQIADSIYRQGELAAANGETDRAVANFQRIEPLFPDLETSVLARFDAANTLLGASRWQAAVTELRRFRQDHGEHPLATSVSNKLVLAYESSGQPARAADELLLASSSEPDPWPKRLRAAELYHRAGLLKSRNELYGQFLSAAPEPIDGEAHIARQQMRQRLVESKVDESRNRIDLVTAELASQWHSDETLTWAGQGALVLGVDAEVAFRAIDLVHPLAETLEHKQKAMEFAVERYRQAGRLGPTTIRSEALYRQAELYRQLSRSLLDSARPEGLSELELEQYQMLLEEEAFPFEELAIEIHAKNHQQLGEGRFDPWIVRSLQALRELYPGRYAREPHWISWDADAPVDGAAVGQALISEESGGGA